MRTENLAQRPRDVVMWDPQPTLGLKLHQARRTLEVQRMVMEILWEERPNPRDRLFSSEPECPRVLEMADRIEQLEAIVRDLERRIRLADRIAV